MRNKFNYNNNTTTMKIITYPLRPANTLYSGLFLKGTQSVKVLLLIH